MGLGVYDGEGTQFTEEGSQVTPITTTHRGNEGESVELLLYLKNNDSNQWFSDITIKSIDTSLPDDTLGDKGTGWGIKLFQGAEQPSATKWASIRYGNNIKMDDVGSLGSPDTSTLLPFWYKITSPPEEDVRTKTDIKLQVDFTRNAV